jgi:PIN domain nuclease of toxin-antitoxin system
MSDGRVVMDASAIVAWLLNERGAATVGRLLQFAVLPAPNVTESIRAARSHGHRMTSD